MKQIEPISIWKNGELKTASVLDAYIVNDNLATSCTFYWMVKEADTVEEEQTIKGAVLENGNLTMSGEDYISWDGSNDFAYDFIAGKLNLIIG